MPFELGSKAKAAGYRLAAFDRIGSTSTEAMAQAKAGETGRLWFVAREQTAGHGRRGRPWQAPRGNLAASLLLPAPGSPAETATLGFAAGLALEGALREVAPELAADVRLKWPNDVLLGGAKIAGILLEASGKSVVTGIGVNVRQTPRDLPYPVTSLAEAGSDATAETLFAALTDAWVEQEALWDHGGGFDAIRSRWLACAAGLGAPIAVRLGTEECRGTFETIDRDGRLVVRQRDGSSRTVNAGDVYFGGAAAAEF